MDVYWVTEVFDRVADSLKGSKKSNFDYISGSNWGLFPTIKLKF